VKKLALDVISNPASLFLVGLADLLSTLMWIKGGLIVEANPLMAAILGAGVVPFVLVKLSTLSAYVIMMKWYRQRSIQRARVIAATATIAYVVIYSLSFLAVNHRFVFGPPA
jgi:hypothetical protein